MAWDLEEYLSRRAAESREEFDRATRKELADEYSAASMADLAQKDNEQRNAMTRLEMMLDETNWRFRCAEKETAGIMARMTANV